jgi:signal transduction histidine kinase
VPETPVVAPVDHARIVQVLSNLIDNASKYSPEGVAIDVVLREGDEVELEVSDNGPGIAEEVLPHVFDVFDQGAPSPGSAGLGMGLGLCKRIVELHGGSVAALANPSGNGATFRIRLPAR